MKLLGSLPLLDQRRSGSKLRIDRSENVTRYRARKSEKRIPVKCSMTVNGKSVSGEVEARTLLVQFLREHLRLTGTHVGCDTSQCGAASFTG